MKTKHNNIPKHQSLNELEEHFSQQKSKIGHSQHQTKRCQRSQVQTQQEVETFPKINFSAHNIVGRNFSRD